MGKNKKLAEGYRVLSRLCRSKLDQNLDAETIGTMCTEGQRHSELQQ